MSIKKILLFVFLLSTFGKIGAQDIHFSQFNFSPLNLNPAMTGFFDGDFRMTANFRSQWDAIRNVSPFRTIAASADLSLLKGKLKSDYLGIGLQFYNDEAGVLNYGTKNFGLSLAYSKGFGWDVKHSIALGFQGGMVQRGFTPGNSEAIYPDDINELALGTLDNSATFIDMSAGLLYHIVPRERLNMYIGGAYQHLNKPKQTFLGDGNETIYPKISLSSGALIEVGNNLNLLPSIMYLNQGPASQTNIGSYIQFILGESYVSETSFSLGFWTRFARTSADAVIIAARFDHKWITAGISYDVTISELSTANKHAGAVELSLIYIGKLRDNKGYKGSYCPTF